MLEAFTTVTANQSTALPCSALRSNVSPAACGVHTLTLRPIFVGVANLVPTFKAHLGFKHMDSCSFRDKRMRLKKRTYGIVLTSKTLEATQGLGPSAIVQ